MKNEIVHRVYTFLRDFPIFILLQEELMALSEQVWVRYLPSGTVLFQIESPLAAIFMWCKQGRSAFTAKTNRLQIVAMREMLGIRPFLANSPYLLKAVATEDSILYGIPATLFLRQMEVNARVARYMAAHFASGVVNYRNENTSNHHANFTEIFTIHHHTGVVYCSPETTIKKQHRP